jgi:hypothetical protein
MAALPTVANGDAEFTVIATVRPVTLPATVGSVGADPPDGDVGLPPHALTTIPVAASDA